MSEILYEEPSIWLFLLVTVVMGGSAAWASGKSIAQTWRPAWQVVPYMLVLGMAVRFIHFALFEGTLLTLHYYLVDTVILLVCGALGFRYKRTQQMTSQYRWLYEKTGPFSWRARPGATA
jgi:hypothetical protein